MKTEYNTDSWHYKLMLVFYSEYNMPRNTCDYWRGFLISMLISIFLLSVTITAVSCVGLILVYEPLKFAYYYFFDHSYYINHIDEFMIVFFLAKVLILVVTLGTFLGILFGIFYTVNAYNNYRRRQIKTTALEDFIATIRNKYCKEIIFIEKEKKNE